MFFVKTYRVWQKYSGVFIRGLGGTLWISAVTLLFGALLLTFLLDEHTNLAKISPIY